MPEFEQDVPVQGAERSNEFLPHFDIPGFDTLSPDRQQAYLQIPAEMLDHVRSLILADIEKTKIKTEEKADGQADIGEGKSEVLASNARELSANEAIVEFHAAEQGDDNARKKLADHEKELTGKQPDDDELWQTILENESTDPTAQDEAMAVLLSDPEAAEAQKIFDLYQEFRGTLPSVDDVISPSLQLDLFLEVTKGKGTIAARKDFMREVLKLLTNNGAQNLDVGLKTYKVAPDGKLYEEAIEDLRQLTENTIRARAMRDAA